MEIGVYGCSVDEEPLPATDETIAVCTSDDECTAKVRSRFPMTHLHGVEMCQCYSASSIDPFDECEGETDSTCRIAKCTNTCDGLEAHCLLSPDSSDGTKVCTLQPISESTPSPISSGSSMTSSSPAPIAAATTTGATSSIITSSLPNNNENSSSSTPAPFVTAQTTTPVTLAPVAPSLTIDNGANSSTTQAPIATVQNTTTLAPVAGEGIIAFAESAGMSLTVLHSILISLLVMCISAFTASCL